MKPTLTLCAAAAFCLGLGQAASAEGLTEAQLRSELIGNQLEGRRLGVKMAIHLHDNGHAELQSTIMDDVGRWRIQGDKLCVTWSSFQGGKERCNGFQREAKGFRMEGGPVLRVAN